MSARARLRALLAGLDERTGLGGLARAVARRPVEGGPAWWRVPLAAFAALAVGQVVTGVALACFYSPGSTSAWGSVLFIEERALLGSVLRGAHAFGASAMVVCLLVGGLGAGLERAYRRPRELAWLLGLAVGGVVAAAALTGYLLPWDQRGYWATRVAAGIVRATPWVGEPASRLFLGGDDLSTLTLTRFYAAHTVLLPALLLGLLGLLALTVHRAAARAPAGSPPWWPGQAWRDGLGVALALGAVLALGAGVGAGREAPADPTSDYPPRPEWYFLPLRELLKSAPEPWGSVVLPGAAALLLAALPWLDRRERPWSGARAALAVPLVAWLALGAVALATDRVDGRYAEGRRAAEAEATLARWLARDGIPPAGAGELLWRHAPRAGERLFAHHCSGCHPLNGRGESAGPELTGYLSEGWLTGVIRDPRHPRFFGNTPIDGMDPLPREAWVHLPALSAFLRAQDPAADPPPDPARVAAGEEAFFALGCGDCHEVEPEAIGAAPNLAGYGSHEWLLRFLTDPGHDLFYGPDNDMPAFGAEELTKAEREALVVFLRGLDGSPVPGHAPPPGGVR